MLFVFYSHLKKKCQVQTEQNAEVRNLYSFSKDYHKMKEEKKTLQ